MRDKVETISTGRSRSVPRDIDSGGGHHSRARCENTGDRPVISEVLGAPSDTLWFPAQSATFLQA